MALQGKLVYNDMEYYVTVSSESSGPKGKNIATLLSTTPVRGEDNIFIKDINQLRTVNLDNYMLETLLLEKTNLEPVDLNGGILSTVFKEISGDIKSKFDDTEDTILKKSVTKKNETVTHRRVVTEYVQFETKDKNKKVSYLDYNRVSDGKHINIGLKDVKSTFTSTICGKVFIDNRMFFVVYRSSSRETKWTLVSPLSKADRLRQIRGEEKQDIEIYSERQLHSVKLDDYILESLILMKTGKVLSYGRLRVIPNIIDTINSALTYSFKPEDIKEDVTRYSVQHNNKLKSFSAQNDEISVSYDRVFRQGFAYLTLAFKNITLDIRPRDIGKLKLDLEYKIVEADKHLTQKVTSAGTMTISDLEMVVDLSWYKTEDGKKLKDYRSIKTNEEFERYVMWELVQEYLKMEKEGKMLDLSLDTETSGLNIYLLSKDNPLKDFIVATPLSWRKDQGVVIFNAMEFFTNVEPEYMFERLRPFLERAKGDGKFTVTVLGQVFELNRNNINLIGHNVLFDGRVLYDNGVKPWWDNDTMSFAFNCNPKAAKGKYNNKLKGLTRRIFGHETPELSDVLGKGSEDKYRYIRDEEVAILYGCADGDYTRQVFGYLYDRVVNNKFGIPSKLYRTYKKQDMALFNALYIPEYEGLRADLPKAMKLAENTKQDIEKLHEFLIHFIGQVIDLQNKEDALVAKYKLGGMTEEEFKLEYSNIKINPKARYEFEMKPNSLRKILFEILKYPTISYTDTGIAKVDKKVMSKLMSQKLEESSGLMKEDLMSSDGKNALIEAREFNKFKYPVAYVLAKYAEINKEYVSYYKPLCEQNMEGRIFKNFSLTRIETFRIMNPSQTMKGSLKELILPHDDDHYMLDFDMAQVEYRIMASIAGLEYMVERLRDPEKDFHTESTATLKHIPAHTVPKKLRKKMKSVHFGIPYGLGERSLCEQMMGAVTTLNMYETRELMNGFKDRNKPVIEMLEHHRDEALIPRNFSNEFKDFCGFFKDVNVDGKVERRYSPVGWVKNAIGRYRLFDLSDLDNSKIGSIRRAAGNFPIQAFAAELFRIILLRFKERCIAEGIDDKVRWHMLIHDELLLSVHKDLNPFYIYKLILEECMVTIKDHTEYFVGINIGSNWEECKDDASEAPVLFVREMAERWDKGEFANDKGSWRDSAKAYVDKYKGKWIAKRIHEVLQQLQPNVDNEPVDYMNIRNNMDNYTVRAYILDFFKPKAYPKSDWKKLNDDCQLLATLATYVQAWYGEDKQIVLANGDLVNFNSLNLGGSAEINLDIKLGQKDADELQDTQDYWSFDEEGFKSVTLEYIDEDVYYDEVKDSFVGLNLKDDTKEELRYVEDFYRQVVVKLDNSSKIMKCKELIHKYTTPKGTPLYFKTPARTEPWLKIDKSKLKEIDEAVGGLM